MSSAAPTTQRSTLSDYRAQVVNNGPSCGNVLCKLARVPKRPVVRCSNYSVCGSVCHVECFSPTDPNKCGPCVASAAAWEKRRSVPQAGASSSSRFRPSVLPSLPRFGSVDASATATADGNAVAGGGGLHGDASSPPPKSTPSLLEEVVPASPEGVYLLG